MNNPPVSPAAPASRKALNWQRSIRAMGRAATDSKPAIRLWRLITATQANGIGISTATGTGVGR